MRLAPYHPPPTSIIETQPGWAATQLLVAGLQLRAIRVLGYRKLVVYVESCGLKH